MRTGRPSYPWIGAIGTALVGSLIAWVAWVIISDAPFIMSVPHPEGRFGHPVGGYAFQLN